MGNNKNLESRLQKLIDIGTSHNLEGIRDFKKQGGKVVGVMSEHVPVEILYAAGILPWRVIGTQNESTPLAGVHRSPATDAYTTHVIEAILNGELDFLDGIIVSNWDDDTKAADYLMRFFDRPRFTFWLEIPINASALALKHYNENLAKMRVAIEEQFGTKISDEKLGDAVKEYNTARKLLYQLYEMRRNNKPPLTGSEVWGIVAAAMAMPQSEFIRQLELLFPYIEQRQPFYKNGQVRILLSSDFMHNVGYIKLIEDVGGIVAMDELDMGSGYFWDMFDEEEGDPLRALAVRYLGPMNSIRMVNWDRQVDQVIEWAKEFRIDGVIEMPVLQSLPRMFRAEYFHRTMEEEGLPHMYIQRDYHLANVAQITTRVEAFAEMLSQMSKA